MSSYKVVDLKRKLRKKIKSIIKKILYVIYVSRPDVLNTSELLRIKILESANTLNKKEFKTYSQHGEDGIIQEIFKRIGTTNKFFFEFGSGDDFENNTIFLLTQDWGGVWVDGDPNNIEFQKKNFNRVIESNKLVLKKNIVTSKNINDLAKEYEVPNELDFLSIDIDSNDYYVWKKCELRPRMLCIEFNGSFPPGSYFIQEESSEWYDGTMWFGAGIQDLTELSNKKGYSLVCVDTSGANLFFVRNDLVGDKFEDVNNIEKLYYPPRYDMHIVSGHARNFK